MKHLYLRGFSDDLRVEFDLQEEHLSSGYAKHHIEACKKSPSINSYRSPDHQAHMATKQETVDFICEQSGLGQRIAAHKMFGEFALYLDGKVIGLVCDNTLYLKPTEAGRSILGITTDRPPYKGAKLHFCIDEQLENRDLVRMLFLATAAALPTPKPKAKPKLQSDIKLPRKR